jgi:hypothetical protein
MASRSNRRRSRARLDGRARAALEAAGVEFIDENGGGGAVEARSAVEFRLPEIVPVASCTLSAMLHI